VLKQNVSGCVKTVRDVSEDVFRMCSEYGSVNHLVYCSRSQREMSLVVWCAVSNFQHVPKPTFCSLTDCNSVFYPQCYLKWLVAYL